MKFKKAIIEQSKEELKAYTDNMKMPEPVFNTTADEKGSNGAESKISFKPSNPDNEELVIQIERAVMLSNFKSADELMRKHYDRLTVRDINQLVQFSRFITGEEIRNIAVKKEKPDFEKFGPKFIKTVMKKMSPK